MHALCQAPCWHQDRQMSTPALPSRSSGFSEVAFGQNVMAWSPAVHPAQMLTLLSSLSRLHLVCMQFPLMEDSSSSSLWPIQILSNLSYCRNLSSSSQPRSRPPSPSKFLLLRRTPNTSSSLSRSKDHMDCRSNLPIPPLSLSAL